LQTHCSLPTIKTIIPCLWLAFLSLSCQSRESIRPFPMRVNLFLPALVSYAGDYSLMPVSFDSLARLILLDPYIDILSPDKLEKRRVVSTNYQNPLLPVYQPLPNAVTVTGEVERISYEPANQVEDRIVSYALGGLLGLAAAGQDGTMAACIQYRFSIKDFNNRTLDSFLIIGASSGDPNKRSRKELMAEANYIAAANCASQLVMRIAKLYNLSLDHLPSESLIHEVAISKCKNFFAIRLRSADVQKNR